MPADSDSPDLRLSTRDGHPYDVPAHGSLGLLALGYVGLLLWRQKRLDAAPTPPTTQPLADETQPEPTP